MPIDFGYRPQTDSWAPLATRLLMQSISDDERYIIVPTHEVFRQLTISIRGSESVAAVHGTISLFFSAYNSRPWKFYGEEGESDFHASLIAKEGFLIGMGTKFKAQWEWDRLSNPSSLGSPPKILTACQYELAVKSQTISYSVEGIGIELDVIGQSVAKSWMTRAESTTKFTNYRVSDIVHEIAVKAGWSFCADSILEETTTRIDEFVISRGDNYLDIIRNRLLPLALNKYGENFVAYFTCNNCFNFHSSVSSEPNVVKRYIAYADISGEVVSFTPSEETIFYAPRGAGGVKFNAVDAKNGAAVNIPSDPWDGVNKAGVGRIHNDEAGRPDPLIGAKSEKYPSGPPVDSKEAAQKQAEARTLKEAEAMARVDSSRFRKENYKADLVVMGTHAVKPTQRIRVDYYNADGSVHYLSGVFTVMDIEHTVSGTWTTKFSLWRQGMPLKDAIKAVRGFGMILDESQAE